MLKENLVFIEIQRTPKSLDMLDILENLGIPKKLKISENLEILDF